MLAENYRVAKLLLLLLVIVGRILCDPHLRHEERTTAGALAHLCTAWNKAAELDRAGQDLKKLRPMGIDWLRTEASRPLSLPPTS